MMQAINTPDAAITSLLIGLLLIYAEFQRPGMIVVGAGGALCTLLSLHELAQMPLNFFAAAGVLTAFPVLYFSGAKPIRVLLGNALLVESLLHLTPHLHVALIATESAVFGLVTTLLAHVAYRARQNKFRLGSAAAVGKRALSATSLAPQGKVELFGQLWAATLREPAQFLEAQRPVLVHSLQDHILLVDAVPE